jgi:glucan phosphoethanolaminetransferase (alkaline phosphatase superfamily)
MTQNPAPSQNKKHHNWKALFHLTVLSAYFYAFMEWLFFATKPSSLSILSLFESVEVLAVTGGAIALTLVIGSVILCLPAWLVNSPKWRPRLLVLSYIPPALLLSITALIMLDNFTYTVFKFGVISMKGLWRAVYALGFVAFFWRMLRFSQRTVRRNKNPASFLTLGLLTVSMAGFLTIRLSNNSSLSNIHFQDSSPDTYPNIIILGSDGLSANYLSAYGYPLKTTPFLNEVAKTSLVAENAFPNASNTTPSTTSVLTGKESITVKVFRYPDILSGKDSFEHLPGILKRQGYKTVEIGTPYYVDSRRLNLLDGFDIVNNQSQDQPAFDALRTVLGNSSSTYFIQTIMDRASERLFHIFFIKQMQNPLAEIYEPTVRMTDEQRVDQIIDLLDHADRPVFIFAHLMDTHGPIFSSQKQVFSNGLDAGDWDQNHYLDAILSFDGHVKKIYEHLAQTGQLNNTILVIYTDHGLKYAINQRIPIIIHFPENAHAGKTNNNVQIIDIPVTLLNYLGIPRPKWMTGTSLLNGEPLADREIISTTAGSPKMIAPPFYQIQSIQVIVCQKWYVLNVREDTWRTGTINGHTAKCAEDILPSEEEVHQTILEYLEKYSYDISSLK